MKKFGLAIVLVFAISVSGYSQVTFGPVIGANLSTLNKVDRSGSPNYTIDGMRPGFLIGFFGRRQFPSAFFLQMGADFRTYVGSSISTNSESVDVGASRISFPVIFGSPLSYNLSWRLGVISGLFQWETPDELLTFLQNNGYGGGVDISYQMDLLVGIEANFSNFKVSLDYQRGIAFPAYFTSGNDHESDIFTSQIVITAGINIAN